MTLTFYEPGILVDEELELILLEKYPGNPVIQWSPSYKFAMTLKGKRKEIGQIQLRLGNTEHILMYAGHVGYRVHRRFRGNRYAARACELLLPLAKKHDLNPLWITTNPDNWASRRTCEILGAELVEIVDVPRHLEMYKQGDRQKCRYRLDL